MTSFPPRLQKCNEKHGDHLQSVIFKTVIIKMNYHGHGFYRQVSIDFPLCIKMVMYLKKLTRVSNVFCINRKVQSHKILKSIINLLIETQRLYVLLWRPCMIKITKNTSWPCNYLCVGGLSRRKRSLREEKGSRRRVQNCFEKRLSLRSVAKCL